LLDDVDEETKAKQKAKSQKLEESADGKKTKGRGFGSERQKEVEERYSGKYGEFDVIEDEDQLGPIRSIEGWIVIVTGIHEEAAEDDILDKFSECGEVRNLQLPLDRKTGYVKGYALIEFSAKNEAERAISELNGTKLNDKAIHVDWAFSRGKNSASSKGRSGGRGEKKYKR